MGRFDRTVPPINQCLAARERQGDTADSLYRNRSCAWVVLESARSWSALILSTANDCPTSIGGWTLHKFFPKLDISSGNELDRALAATWPPARGLHAVARPEAPWPIRTGTDAENRQIR
jgi:hypothetical protein